MNEYMWYIIVIIVVVIGFTFTSTFTNKFTNDLPQKGSRIILSNDNYPQLLLFFINDGKNRIMKYAKSETIVAVFDKNMKDYIGTLTKSELVKMLNKPTVYNFDDMNNNEFVKLFEKVLRENGKDPSELYNIYRSFSVNQLYSYDLNITKDEFINRYGNDIRHTNFDPNYVYDKLKEKNIK